jgi:carbon monoxide dehydrogenase subunit G
MPIIWERTGQTKAPLPKVIEYFMSPENAVKNHPKLVGDIKNVRREGDAVTWDQRLVVMRMSFRSVVRTSLDRATNTTRTESIEGSGKGTTMVRVMRETPTGTEVHFTYSLKLGRLIRFFVEGRAKRGFEETVDEDMTALEGLA